MVQYVAQCYRSSNFGVIRSLVILVHNTRCATCAMLLLSGYCHPAGILLFNKNLISPLGMLASI